MSFKKTSGSSGEITPLNPDKSKMEFPVGTRFMLSDRFWAVKEASVDDNTEMRRVLADDGVEETLMLSTLIRDKTAGSLEFLADGLKPNMPGMPIEKEAEAEDAPAEESKDEE